MTINILLRLTLLLGPQSSDLAGRIESGPDGFVSVSYAARSDVCGSGYNFLRVGQPGFGDGGYSYIWSEGSNGNACERGPVRLLLGRVSGKIASVRVGIGAVELPMGATDLGLVPARDASGYLFGLAGRLDGRVGREALTAAVLADSAETGRSLLALAANRGLSRGLRESAASWLGRDAGWETGRSSGLVDGVAGLARDADAPTAVRSRAITALGRAGGAAVIPVLVEFARSEDAAVAKAATAALGRSLDPRAREAVRRAAADSSRPRSVRLEAVRALGGRDAVPADLAALRALWPGLGGELRGAVMQQAAEAGGAENARWLLSVAQAEAEAPAVRAQAVRWAEQAGAGTADLVRLFDQAADRKVKDAVLDALLRIGDRPARAKLVAVAESDTDPQLRKAAISRLSRDGDRQSLGVLEGVVARPLPQDR